MTYPITSATALLVLGRNLLIDLDSSMQGSGEWRIFHNGNRMLPGDLADLQSHGVDALGHTNQRVHAPLILEGKRVVRRVRDNHRGSGDRSDHAPAHADLPHLLHLPLMAGSPSACLNSSFNSRSDIF